MKRMNSRMISHANLAGTWGNARSMRSAAILIAIPFAFLAGCKREEAPEREDTVQTEHPEQGAISEHIVSYAMLSPLAQAAIVPKIVAPVREFYVQRGAHVKEGELLAALEN